MTDTPTAAPTAADVTLDDFGLFDPAVQRCPHPYYALMREQAPVFEVAAPGSPLLLVTRHEDVTAVLKDTETFSSRFDTSGMMADSDAAQRIRQLYIDEDGYDKVGTMLTVDPPAHTRYRRLISRAFTPRVINDLEPVVRQITGALIDDMLARAAEGKTVEFVEAFAIPLPVTVIAKALNVPDDRLADFKRWSDASIAGIGTNIGIEERLEAEREVIEYQHYFAEQLNLRRDAPQDDILTNLLNARIDKAENPDVPDEALTMPEMLSMIQQLLVAGNETTTKMLTEMMRLLAETPQEWRQLQADPSRAHDVIEETLRMSTPTQGMFRVVTRDTQIAGVDVPAGTRLVAMFSSANRDAEIFDEPESFCPARANVTSHLAFGKGVHFCLGAALSRLEGRVAAEELSGRIASFTLADSNDFDYHPSFMLRGLKKLDIEITAHPS